jgi:hypothetical protein
MNNDARTVRSYRKNSAIQVPATPDYLSPFLSQSTLSSTSPAVNSLVASSPDGLWASTSTNSLAASGSPFNVLGSSSQPRLIQPRKNEKAKLEAKFKRMEEFLGNSGFDSIGDFLEILFYNPTRVDGKADPRGVTHGLAVARFLQGKTKTKMSEIIGLVYSHKHSAPSPRSTQYHERHASFSPSISPAAINHARPSLFTWATNLVGNHVHQEIRKLTMKDDDTQLRASTNGRRPNDSVRLVTWETLGKFSIAGLCEKYKARAPVSWYLTESMAASRKNGAVITKRRRPHPIVRILSQLAV